MTARIPLVVNLGLVAVGLLPRHQALRLGRLIARKYPHLVFLEPMFGGAVHDGNATAIPVPDENTLGCRVLFDTGLSGGYRLTEQWTALLTWDHISNAHLCAHNAGMNEYGVKIGYSF
jgi:hypothetical protein